MKKKVVIAPDNKKAIAFFEELKVRKAENRRKMESRMEEKIQRLKLS